MLEAKATHLDRFQSRVADVIAEEISIQQGIDDELRQLIKERTQSLQEAIAEENDRNDETVQNLRDYLQHSIPALYEQLKQSIAHRETIEETI